MKSKNAYALKQNPETKQEKFQNCSIEYLMDQWLITKTAQCRESTLTNYQNKISLYILPKLGALTASELTTEIVQECFDDMQKYLNAASIRLVFQIFKQFLFYLEEEEIITTKIYKKIILPPMSKKKVSALSYSQQQQLEKYLTTKNELPILLALDTGLRIGEICGLMWDDIDFETNQIFVTRTVQRTKNTEENLSKRTCFTTTQTKSDSSIRVVPITKRLRQELKTATHNGPYIFTKNGTTPIDPRTLRYRLRKVQEKAGLPFFNFHTLRHTFATRCIEAGVVISTVSALLGHSSIKMTLDIYVNSFTKEKHYGIYLLEQSYDKRNQKH